MYVVVAVVVILRIHLYCSILIKIFRCGNCTYLICIVDACRKICGGQSVLNQWLKWIVKGVSGQGAEEAENNMP